MRSRPALAALAFVLAATAAAACSGGDGGPAPIIPTSIAFAVEPDSALVGDSVALGGRAIDASGRTAPNYAIVYTSSDGFVVRVDSTTGVVHFVGAGSATVTAHTTGVPGVGSLSHATHPLVSLLPAARIRALPGRVDAAPGSTVGISAVVYEAGGNAISYPVSYTSDNAAVAAVSSVAPGSIAGAAAATTGSIAVAAAGSATITVRADFRGHGLTTMIPLTAAPIAPGPFHIDLVAVGPVNPTYAALFARAAAFWQSVLTTALPSAALNVDTATCGAGTPAVNTVTTGVTIFFRVDSIDGLGKILGAAGPCILRSDAATGARGLPVLGTMRLDSADIGALVARGMAYDVIRHEMGHVLGIGTLWNVSGVRAYLSGYNTFDPQYVGPAGESASAVLGFTAGGVGVPVENTGGSGTANSHWRSSVFASELMTGYLMSAPTHPASRLTILSLADLGYNVNVFASEPILPAVPAPLTTARGPRASLAAGDALSDVALPPLFTLEAGGHARRLSATSPFEASIGVR